MSFVSVVVLVLGVVLVMWFMECVWVLMVLR